MTTFYEELKQRAAEAMPQYLRYQSDCARLASQVVDYVKAEIGAPDAAVVRPRIDYDNLRPGSEPAAGGWIDKSGRYGFAVEFHVGRGYVGFEWHVYREQGHWLLSYQESKQVTLSKDGPINAPDLVRYVRDALSETVDEQYRVKRWS